MDEEDSARRSPSACFDTFDYSSNNAEAQMQTASAIATPQPSWTRINWSDGNSSGSSSSMQMHPEPVALVQPMVYRHKKLQGNQIRLMRLLPLTATGSEAVIRVRLLAVSIEETVGLRYEALSYAWGPSRENVNIYIGDEAGLVDGGTPALPPLLPQVFLPFSVRPNLFAALRRLRSPTHDVLVWVDAVCIDQTNDAEKTSQLPQMPRVYGNAWSVVVWIGEEPGRAHRERLAMEFIPRVLNLTLLDSLLVHGDGADETADAWLAFADLLKRPWFHRRWVVQEVAYARRVAIRCGEHVMSWLDFADAVEILMRRLDRVIDLCKAHARTLGGQVDTAFEHVQSGRAMALVSATNTVFRKTRSGDVLDRLWSLESLVTELSSFETADPRDIIYAYLSLANDGPLAAGGGSVIRDRGRESSDNGSELLPQYEKKAVDVYIDFVRYCVETTQSLDIICRYWASPTRGTPSWIGQVRRSAFGSPSQSNTRINADSLVGRSKQRIYNASRGRRAEARFEKPQRIVPTWETVQPQETEQLQEAAQLQEEQYQHQHQHQQMASLAATQTLSTSPQTLPASLPVTGSKRKASLGVSNTPSERMARRKRQAVMVRELMFWRRLKDSACCLFARGIVLGCIQRVSPRIVHGIVPSDCLEMLGWQGPNDQDGMESRRQQHSFSRYDRFPDALWRTLVADRDPDGRNAPMWYKRACAYAMLRVSPEGDLDTARIIAGGSSSGSVGGNSGGGIGDGGGVDISGNSGRGRDAQPEAIVEFCRRVQSVVWNRTVFVCEREGESDERGGGFDRGGHADELEDNIGVTSPLGSDITSFETDGHSCRSPSVGSERMVGLGSRNTAAGDLVCILFGCSVPVVLSRNELGIYRLVGEAYVYGKMDGEAFAGMDSKVIQDQTVEFGIR